MPFKFVQTGPVSAGPRYFRKRRPAVHYDHRSRRSIDEDEIIHVPHGRDDVVVPQFGLVARTADAPPLKTVTPPFRLTMRLKSMANPGILRFECQRRDQSAGPSFERRNRRV